MLLRSRESQESRSEQEGVRIMDEENQIFRVNSYQTGVGKCKGFFKRRFVFADEWRKLWALCGNWGQFKFELVLSRSQQR